MTRWHVEGGLPLIPLAKKNPTPAHHEEGGMIPEASDSEIYRA